MCPTPDSTLADPQQIIADLQRQLAESNAERDEALEQQTASAEVLQVINSSPGDLAPVFDAMLEKATRLCEATYGDLYTYDGSRYHPVAVHGEAEFVEWRRQRGAFAASSAGAPLDRLIAGEQVVAIDDAPSTEAYRASPGFRGLVDASGIRSGITVGLRKEGTLLGAITVYRQEVRPFTDKQIALLQNFAAQAVIAMENARLLTETREALEQQTATAEVLQVINSSPGDLAPVFDAMLDNAMQLCTASFGILWTYDGEHLHAAAQRGVPKAYAEFIAKGPHRADLDPLTRRFLEGEHFRHGIDVAASEPYHSGNPFARALVDLGGGRSLLSVPLRKDNALLGLFIIYRQEVRPFTDKQIALLQNFAAQAVIAIENARLLTETREALEQQTATAEVLQVINSSPGDLPPVFDAMLEKTIRLCDAKFGQLVTSADGEVFTVAAAHGPRRLSSSCETARRPGPVPAPRSNDWCAENDAFTSTTPWPKKPIGGAIRHGAPWSISAGAVRLSASDCARTIRCSA